MSMKKFINLLFCKFLFKVSYFGLENLEKYNQFLICPNHSCIFDPFFIYPKSKNLYIMAKSELFKYPFLSSLLTHYNVFPVNRNTVDSKSLFKALCVFKNNTNSQLLLFPEGKVIKQQDEIGKKVRNGATFISAQENVPIVPVYISRRPTLFSHVSVIFGEPFFIDSTALENRSYLKQCSKNLIDTIYSLKK